MPLACVYTHAHMTANGENGPSPPVFPLSMLPPSWQHRTVGSDRGSPVYVGKKTWGETGHPALISHF